MPKSLRTSRTCPSEHFVGARVWIELLVFIHARTAVHPHRRSSFCLVVHVCATANLPNVVLDGACGPALSELVVITENV